MYKRVIGQVFQILEHFIKNNSQKVHNFIKVLKLAHINDDIFYKILRFAKPCLIILGWIFFLQI